MPTFSIGYLIFSGLTALDLFGPLQALNLLSIKQPLSLSLISTSLDPVTIDHSPFFLQSARPISSGFHQTILPTHTLTTAPEDLDIIIVPGGAEARNQNGTQPYVDFLKERYGSANTTAGTHVNNLSYLMSICTGASLLARAGLLDGRDATTNKNAWAFVRGKGAEVNWVPKARWVVDGNVWTSSGVSAGTDMTLAWIEEVYGAEQAYNITKLMEWNRLGREEDPWSFLVPGQG
ncbi:ThiJ/PfpI family protein [Elsinoe ampelina]|uniref:ThiJ/PfpI family protein n=1 Tax=Elsinoe ampelina TaxID=302913 RepID=A0A6A6GE70_9PEZI|nr:ThiJ/PfpI family protein [Elsinoe ampelina]